MRPETPESGNPYAPDASAQPYLSVVDQQWFSGKAMAELVRAVTEHGRSFRLQAPGLSMHPFIQHGDTLVISPLKGPPKTGQVLATAMPPDGRLVVHRLIRQHASWIQTQGDNCDEPDPHIDPGAVLGVVTAVRRRGHRVCAPLNLGGRLLVICLRFGCPIRPHRWLWWLSLPLRPVLGRMRRMDWYRRWMRRRLSGMPVRLADALDCLLIGVPPRSLLMKDQTIWVAGESPKVCGSVALVRQWHPESGAASWWLYALHVNGMYRGGGLAERLCDAVHQCAYREGADAVYLWVRTDNEPALRLYTRLGYAAAMQPVGQAPFEGCICLRKELP